LPVSEFKNRERERESEREREREREREGERKVKVEMSEHLQQNKNTPNYKQVGAVPPKSQIFRGCT
jgi:hypothetical protein